MDSTDTPGRGAQGGSVANVEVRDNDLAQFVSTQWLRLVRTAYLLGCDPAEAEDLVQSILVKCVRHWGKIDSSRDPQAYVTRMLANEFTSTRRRLWRGESAAGLAPTTSADSSFDHGEEPLDLDIRAALRKLPDKQRTVVVLRYLLDYSEKDVAEVLDVPIGTVKSRATRALTRMRAVLAVEIWTDDD